MTKIKVDVISGFLGAGKTTLLSKYVSYRIKNGEKVAIIENEFGEIGIDGIFLKSEGLSIYEMVNGCICCSLKGDIISTLRNLAEQGNVNRVIIEPTGIFMLNEIYEIIAQSEINKDYEMGAVVTIVDGKNFLKQQKKYSWFFENQIKWAHRLVLSKTGLIDKDKIIETILSLQNISEKLDIEAAEWETFTPKDWERIFSQNNTFLDYYKSNDHNLETDYSHTSNQVHKGFKGISLSCNRTFDKYSLEATIKMLSSDIFGDIPRAKGIVNSEKRGSLEFDFVNGDIDVRFKDEKVEQGSVSFIGVGIQKAALLKLFS